jgi:hypothetical protein
MRPAWIYAAMVAGLLGSRPPLEVRAQLTPSQATGILEAHNRWRAFHSAAPLGWSDELARYAQAWAETLVRQHPGKLLHSESSDGVRPEAGDLGYGGWGENLYWGSALLWSDGRREAQLDLAARDVVDSWGREVEWYDFDTGRCSPQGEDGCGHFTQIVWMGTTTVGCGRAIGADRAQVWVCSYDPPGNYVGEHADNVRPRGKP